MDPTRAAIEKDRVTAIALLVMLGAGLVAYQEMEHAEDPAFTPRIVQVVTVRPGMSPDRVEQLMTDRIEAAIRQVPEVDYVVSTSRTGVSSVMVQVRSEFDELEPIVDRLRRRVEEAAPDLPAGVIGPTVTYAEDIFGILVAITGEDYTHAELKAVAERLREDLVLMDDVSRVDIYGARAERLLVEYDHARLAELGLAPLQLRSILENVNTVSHASDILVDAERIVVEPTGNFRTVDALRRTVVTLPGRSEVVYLEDLADISREHVEPPTSAVLASGAPALAVGIAMRDGGDATALGEGVVDTLDRFRARAPIGVEFDVVAFQPETVDTLIRSFGVNLLQAVAFVLVVALAFLGLRPGIIVASLVPMSIVVSLPVLSFFGVGINQVTLAALVISLGLLVDNAIVMAESVTVEMAGGRSPVEAAVGAARELRLPLLIASLTTAAAFLPLFLAQSPSVEYTASLFTVVTVTLVSAWILALTVTPLLCVRFLRVPPISQRERFYGRFYRWYRSLLLTGLRHRMPAVAAGVGLFVLAMLAARFVPSIFFPSSNKWVFTAAFELPAGTAIERTREVAAAVDGFIADNLRAGGGRAPGADPRRGPDRREGVTNWVTFVGGGEPRFYVAHWPSPPEPRLAFSILNATSHDVILSELIPRIEAFCRERFPDLAVTLEPQKLGPPVRAPVEVRLTGRDEAALARSVDAVKARMRSIRGIRQIADDRGVHNKKVVVEVDQARARRAGVTNQDVAVSLQTALAGLEATHYRGDEEIMPVVLRSTLTSGSDVTKLYGLNVHSQATGRPVSLPQVANVVIAGEPSTLHRRNGVRTVTVSAGLDPGATASEAVAQLRPWLEAEQATWPLGHRFAFGGEEEASADANRAIIAQLPVSMLVITMLLVGHFNSVRRAAIILLTIPLGTIGVVLGLLVTQSHFGLMTLLGGVALSGIVINNAIILLDRIRIEIDQRGLDPPRAIFAATQQRIRPILLTTATTVASLVPLWLGGGPMWEPLAIAMIFGLLFATVLSLVLAPILYSLFFRVRFDGFRYLRTRLTLDAFPRIDAFLTRFAGGLGWHGPPLERLRSVGEEALLALLRQHEAETPPRRGQDPSRGPSSTPPAAGAEAETAPAAGSLLLVARTHGAAAELQFIVATSETNAEDRMLLFAQRTTDPSVASIEQDVSLRLLRHHASSVHHERHYDTDLVTVRVEPDASPPEREGE